MFSVRLLPVYCALCLVPVSAGLSPGKRFTQYTHRIWTQADGLPQDTIRAIAQTPDGYLWIGTDEGLARFDGYRFVVYRKHEKELPSSAITALCAASDGTLWIGSSGGLTAYSNGHFRTYTAVEGMPSSLVTDVREGPDRSIWAATGLQLTRLRDGRITNYVAPDGTGINGVRAVLPDRDGTVWVAGYGALGRVQDGKLVAVSSGGELEKNIATALLRDRAGNLLIAGIQGLFVYNAQQQWKRYTSADGLPDTFVRSIAEDRDGNLWVGTNGGLARRAGNRFVDLSHDTLRSHEWVWCTFEDADGSLWVGTNNGLHQFLDQQFTVFTRAEGLPSDQPTAVFEDRSRRLWLGFHDRGAGYFEGDRFVTVSGLPSSEIFSIRGTRNGDVLVGSRGGLSRIRNRRVVGTVVPSDRVGRTNVFDASEDSRGRVWAATNQGLVRIDGRQVTPTQVGGGTLLNDAVVVLAEAPDGGIWAGTYARGLYYFKDGQARHYDTTAGLVNEQIRCIHPESDGTVWIGTFNGGLARFRAGRFAAVGTQHGLPSDNIARIIDDGTGAFWIATTRGLARVDKQRLNEVADGRRAALNPKLYGIADGLRSAQCAPGYPIASGGARASDGRLWFPTGNGVAVLDPHELAHGRKPPPAHIVDLLVDGRPVDLNQPLRLPPETHRLEFRYAAVELSNPGLLRYRFRLQGIDRDWIQAETRRVAEYSNLPHGNYQFTVAATLNETSGYGPPARFGFSREPHVYELWTVRAAFAALLAAAIWFVYRWRLRQVQRGFALVLGERARLAREIHDTLAQGFVGIASQLDAVAMVLRDRPELAARHLELARRMSQHSVTEARRSIMDLRAQALDESDLPGAIRSAAKHITAGTSIHTDIDVDGVPSELSKDIEQQLLRITQEAVSNAVKHASASTIRIELGCTDGHVRLAVRDDGRGFPAQDAFLSTGGHFGLLGMRERAERIGGRLDLASEPGHGTTIEVSVPLP